MTRRWLLALALVASPLRAAAQDGPSPGTAQLVGALSTAVPVGAGLVLTAATQDVGWVLVLGGAGMVLGPTVGNIVGGLGVRAALGAVARGGTWFGATALLFAYANDESSNAEPYLVGAIAGYAVLTGLTVVDLVTIPGAVRSKRGLEVSLAPTWVPATRSPGLALHLTF